MSETVVDETWVFQAIRMRRRWKRRLAGVGALAGLLCLLSPILWAVGILIPVGGVMFLWGIARYVRLRTEPIMPFETQFGQSATMQFGSKAITIKVDDVSTILSLDRIVQGWSISGADTKTVVLELDDGDVYAVAVRTEAQAQALLAAVGVSADQKLVHTRIAPATAGTAAGCLAMVVASIAMITFMIGVSQFVFGTESAVSYVLVAATLAIFGVLVEAAYPPVLTVGLDGVWVRTLLRKRFVSWSNVASITPVSGTSMLEMQDGTATRIKAFQRGGPRESAVAGLTLQDLLTRAFDASLARRADAKLGELLDRGEGKFDEWIARLGRVAHSDDYRTRAVTVEDLSIVVRDAGAPAQRRIAAAVALRVEDKEHEALRAAVHTTVDDDLRTALEAAANDELTEELAEKAIARAEQR